MDSDCSLNAPDVLALDVSSFDLLSTNEKEYVNYVDEIAWIGALIDLIQLSPEAPGIFLLGQKIFEKQTISELKILAKDISNHDFDAFVSYFASIFGNLGNYHSFGDTKFVPALEKTIFHQIVSLTTAYHFSDDVQSVFDVLIDTIYSTKPNVLRLAFPPDGITTYYSRNCTKDDAEKVQRYLKLKKTEAYNTRIFKSFDDEKGHNHYILCFASADCGEEKVSDFESLDDFNITKKFGDYYELMDILVQGIVKVKSKALNETQRQMWSEYQRSFKTGSIDAHKEGSKLWVTDKQPAVESYIGFIESYRDPYGVRGEFETFVAVVNKDVSRKFQNLVSNATSFLPLLPWPADYEREIFLEPDFTSLDIISFAVSGLPVGINIPNYDDVRQNIGFKNVSLGNILKARFQDPKATYLKEEDKSIYLKNVGHAFDIQVGLHELLGHGSGKLFCRKDDGTFNFKSSVRDLVTGGDITYWYAPGETWDSKFCSIASPFEECRAECVGIYLCDVSNILNIFDEEGVYNPEDVIFTNWLSMVRSGLMGLEMFSLANNDGDVGAWRQAHCQARFAILQVLLNCDQQVVRIVQMEGADHKPDLQIELDRSLLQSVAKPAIGRFMSMLQYYKSTGNVADGSNFFVKYCTPTPVQLEWRKIILDRKQPRPIYVQPVTFKQDGNVLLKNYPSCNEGIIQSFVDRYSDQRLFGRKALTALESAWKRDLQSGHFSVAS